MFLLRAIILFSSVAFTFGGNAPSGGRSAPSPPRFRNSEYAGPSNAASTTQSAGSSSGPATRPPSTSAASSLREPGENDDWVPASLPWMVSLGQRLNGLHHHICPGALAFIDNARAGRLVLTTATCAEKINDTEEAQAMLHDGRTVNIVKKEWNEDHLSVGDVLHLAAITGNTIAAFTGSNMVQHSNIGVIVLEEQFRDRTISFVTQRNYYPRGPAMIASWRDVGGDEYEAVQKNVTVVDPDSCKAALEGALADGRFLRLVFYKFLINNALILCVSDAAGAEIGTPLFLSGSRHSILGMAVHHMVGHTAFINLHNTIHKKVIIALVEELIRQMNAAGIN